MRDWLKSLSPILVGPLSPRQPTHTPGQNATKHTNLISCFRRYIIYLDNVALQVRTVITLEPGGEVRRRKLKESRNPGLRLGSREDARKLREEIEQKATEGRIRRVKDVDGREETEKSVGGRGGEVEVRMRKEDGRGFGRAGGGGGGNPEGRARSWMLPRLSSPAVQVSPGSCHRIGTKTVNPMKVTNESQIQSKIED